MGKLNRDDYGNRREKVTQDDLESEVAVVTIVEAEEVDATDSESPTGYRKALVLSFEEIPNKVLWPGAKEVHALIDQLGDDTDKWLGRKIPIERATVRFRGRDYDKVVVAPSAEWEQYISPKAVTTRRKKA